MDYTKLSKEISYALRHNPVEYELELDQEGWVSIDALIESFRRKSKWHNLQISDIELAIKNSSKKRHETKDGMIRALYGHSIDKTIIKETVEPPVILYHGTANRFVELIRTQGLLPQGRQFVHLSEGDDVATIVGMRRDSKPVILIVKAMDAFNDGINFYHGNEDIWMSEPIPPKYIEFD